MKKLSNAALLIDSVTALIQTILFALVPIIFEKEIFYQIISYLFLLSAQIIYMVFLRKKVVDLLIMPKGIDTDLVLATNCADSLRGKILMQVCELNVASGTSDFDQYVMYLKWQDAALFILHHFWDGQIVNVVREKSVRQSMKKVYTNELVQYVDILIRTYDKNDKFKKTATLFNCQTLTRDIERIYNGLVEIKTNLEK